MAKVAIATLRGDVWTAINTLVQGNKPTYTYNSATQTYSVSANYPRQNPTFPLIVIPKSSVSINKLTLDAGTFTYDIEVRLDMYAKELHGEKAIEAAQDSLFNTFLGNISNFDTNNGLLPQEKFWDDSNVAKYKDREQVLNVGSSIARFWMQ